MIKFKVLIKGTKYHYIVLIFDTKKGMYDYYDSVSYKYPEDKTRKYEARFLSENEGSRIGTIIFYKGCSDPGTIAHECLHGVSWYLRSIKHTEIPHLGFILGSEEEEIMCDLLDNLVQGLHKKLKKYV